MPSCATIITPSSARSIHILGTREAATPLRSQVEEALSACAGPVSVDFDGLLATQSFMDEFLGMLILRHGPSVLDRLRLLNCHEDVQAVARLVTEIRSRDFEAARQ
jgi:hypothetical protein